MFYVNKEKFKTLYRDNSTGFRRYDIISECWCVTPERDLSELEQLEMSELEAIEYILKYRLLNISLYDDSEECLKCHETLKKIERFNNCVANLTNTTNTTNTTNN